MNKPLLRAIEILKKVGVSESFLKDIQDETKVEAVEVDTVVEEIFNGWPLPVSTA